MKRTDRLFLLIQILHDGRQHTAAEMAGQLGVSVRTIWRDMDVLQASGVPVSGARGSGYGMTAPITLPPVSMTETELEALRLGLSVVAESADTELQEAARALQERISALMPGYPLASTAGLGLAGFPFADAASGFAHMPTLRAAIRDRRELRLTYEETDQSRTEDVIRPLHMEYWGRFWTLTAWCDHRQDFHVFRVERIRALRETGDLFEDEPGKRLSDHLARYAEGPYGN